MTKPSFVSRSIVVLFCCAFLWSVLGFMPGFVTVSVHAQELEGAGDAEDEYLVYLPAVGNSPPPSTPPFSDTALIPESSFTMGCDPAVDGWKCLQFFIPETPYHTVNLSAYRIDKYKVTNARYMECVDAGNCSAPQSTRAYRYYVGRDYHEEYYEYYGVAEYANHPVVNVTWHQADAFCRATGGRLPTEAEWERAARGKNDRRFWPWEAVTATCFHANLYQSTSHEHCDVGQLTSVDAYPLGASPDGVMDMVGNAWEWVNDWAYREYSEDAVTNPLGPESGPYRILRGGSFREYAHFARVSVRFFTFADDSSDVVGFRCAYSP